MAAQPGGQDADKNAYYILWVLALITVVAGVIWYFFDVPLKQFFIGLRLVELTGIYYFLKIIPENLPILGQEIQTLLAQISTDLELVRVLTPDGLNLDIAYDLSMNAGECLRYPIGLYLGVLCVCVLKTNVQMRMKTKHTMKTLAAQEQVNWPQIKIATTEDILNQDLDSGPWAMAMSPIQFAKRNKLVSIELAPLAHSPFSKVQAPEYKITLDRVRAERAFSVQLGRPWRSIEAMPPHRRAIFAVFAARGARDSKVALNLVAQLSRTAPDGKLDCSGVDALWQKHYNHRTVQEICARHAYEFTVFISLLQFAREDGVMAAADFLWVKPIDRRLWYVINNVGRQTPNVEVGGIFSHWYYETALKRPLNAPRVDGAVIALEIALSELNYVPTEQEKAAIQERSESNHPKEQEAV